MGRKKPSNDREIEARRQLLAKEWVPNSEVKPFENYRPYSHKMGTWKCSVCGHVWKNSITNRMSGSGCPACAGRVVTDMNNLAVRYPDIAKQWDFEKNGALKPTDVTPQSHRSAYFTCQNGHSYRRRIYQMVNIGGCKFCAGQAATEDRNLAIAHPELLKEWHPTKNGDLTPDQLLPQSNRKVWWRCHRGHEWQTTVNKRTWRGDRCPYCWPKASYAQFRVYAELKTLFPDALSEARRAGCLIDILIPCLQLAIEVDGYPWHLGRFDHDNRKTAILKDIGISMVRLRDEKLPEIEDPHVKFNNTIQKARIDELLQLIITTLPATSGPLSDRVRDYVAEDHYCGDEEYTRLCATNKTVPKNQSLAARFPLVALEWDYAQNGDLLPTHCHAKARRKAWFICPDCGRSYEARVSHRTDSGSACPYCSGKLLDHASSLGKLYPELLKEIHPTKNGELDPFKISPHSNKNIVWVCPHGHEYTAPPNRRVSTFKKTGRFSGCVHCYRGRG